MTDLDLAPIEARAIGPALHEAPWRVRKDIHAIIAEIKRLRAAIARKDAALKPFADFAPQVEAFIDGRVAAANDVSGIMPTKHFRLAHFRDAVAG